MRNNGSLRVSLITQVLLAVYFQAISWFSLGPWNDQPGFVPLLNAEKIGWGDLGTACVFLLPVLLFSLAYWRHWTWLMGIGAIGYGAWLYFQVRTWWIPYLFGASPQWEEIYNRVFGRSTKILPSFGRHLAPDAMHLTIQLLLIVIVVTTLIGLLKSRPPKTALR